MDQVLVWPRRAADTHSGADGDLALHVVGAQPVIDKKAHQVLLRTYALVPDVLGLWSHYHPRMLSGLTEQYEHWPCQRRRRQPALAPGPCRTDSKQPGRRCRAWSIGARSARLLIPMVSTAVPTPCCHP